jgi:nitric oxide reductase NorQ protein
VKKEQFVLRVKYGSELGNILEGLSEEDLDGKTLNEISGRNRGYWLSRRLPAWFDNVAVSVKGKDKKVSLHYTNVMPNKVNVVTSDVNFQGNGAGVEAPAAEEDASSLRWPLAPPLIDEMENFDKPRWYDAMEFAIKHGRHIALEGPPGTGKDTAVQQLAAKMGRPMVTIGGDAGFRRRDLVGTAHISNGTSYIEVGEYVAAAINGWWVLLTEVNAADPDALMYINAQLAPPYVVTIQGKAYPVHEDFRIFVSYNHGLIGTKPLPQSFKDRFFSIKVPFFTESQLRRRLSMMGMLSLPSAEYPNSVIVQFGVEMWDAHVRGQMRYQITTRRLKDALLLVNVGDYSPKEALKAAVISAIDSPVEAKAATEVLSKVLRGLPEPVNVGVDMGTGNSESITFERSN